MHNIDVVIIVQNQGISTKPEGPRRRARCASTRYIDTPITPSTEGVEGLCHARHPQFRSRGTLVATDSPDRTRSDRRDDVEAHRAHRYRSAICLIIWYCDIHGYGDLNPKSLETVVKIGAADNLLYTGSAPRGPTRPCQARPEAPRLRAPWDVHVGSMILPRSTCHRSQCALTNSLTSAGRTSTASQATRKEARSSARLRKARAETLKMSRREPAPFHRGELGSEVMRIGGHWAIEARALTSAHY